MIEINKSLHGAKGKIKAVYLGTTPVVIYLGDQLLYDVDLNAEYVLMDIQDGDTVDSTIEAPVKSAILKGNTLVNIIDNNNWIQNSTDSLFTQNINIKQGSMYTVIGKIESSDIYTNENTAPAFRICAGTDVSGTSLFFIQQSNAVIKQTFINNENDTIHIRFYNQKTNYKKLMIIEGDHTQEDIPYFTGMQSINLYPDHTVTKLVWKAGKYYGDNGQLTTVNASQNHRYIDEYVKISPNMTYRVSGNNNYKNLNFYDENKNHLLKVTSKSQLGYGALTGDIVATAPNNAKYLRYNMAVGDNLTESTIIYNDTIGIPLASTSISETYTHKMPVLTTMNNSANILTDSYLNHETGEIQPHNNSNKAIEDYILIPNNPVIISNVSWILIVFYDTNKVCISYVGGDGDYSSFELNDTTIPTNAKYFRFHYNSENLPLIRFVNGTDYIKATIGGEPFKSNILTVNEPIELRGIGDVQDTLDLLTCEVTQYFDEIILDGSDDEKFIYLPDYSNNDVALFEWQDYFDYNLDVLKRQGNMISDKFSVNSAFLNPTKEGVYCQFRHLDIMIDKSKLIGLTTTGIRAYLKQNPIKMILPKQNTVKTVDLTIQNQDNKTILTLNTFNDTTHFTVKEKDGKLQPVVSMEIACNPSQAISELSDKTEQLQQEQQELTEQVEQQEQDTNNLQNATTDLEEV